MLKYEFECIKNIKWVKSKVNVIQSNKKTVLTSQFMTILDLIDQTMDCLLPAMQKQ